MGSGPSLTMIFIGVAVFVSLMFLSMNAYTDVLTQAQVYHDEVDGDAYYPQADSAFMDRYLNISNKQTELDGSKNSFSSITFSGAIETTIVTIQSLLGFGFGAISGLASSLGIIQEIINLVKETYPLLEQVFWLFTFVVVVYLASRFIKVIRQDPEEM